MSKFKREDRYLVIKRSDIPHLPAEEQRSLAYIAGLIEENRLIRGKLPVECVVVEKDWPEYEVVFKMIEARVNGSTEFHTDHANHDKPTSTP